jgi:hypothetical protein
MAKYKLIVPNGAKDFQFGQKTYSAGNDFETDDPCEAKSFYNAARTTNPDIGREDQTKDFWKNVDARCSAQQAANPTPPPVTPPQDVDPSPSGGDSPDKQGAPKKPDSGNVGGTTITPPDETPADPVPTEAPPAGTPNRGSRVLWSEAAIVRGGGAEESADFGCDDHTPHRFHGRMPAGN